MTPLTESSHLFFFWYKPGKPFLINLKKKSPLRLVKQQHVPVRKKKREKKDNSIARYRLQMYEKKNPSNKTSNKVGKLTDLKFIPISRTED